MDYDGKILLRLCCYNNYSLHVIEQPVDYEVALREFRKHFLTKTFTIITNICNLCKFNCG